MKKILSFLVVAVLAIGSAFAQKGQMALGVDFNIVPSVESGLDVTNFGIGAKWQYGVTDAVRLDADIDYLFKNKGLSQFDIIANVHYVFGIGRNCNMYPLAGIGYADVKAGPYSFDRFLFNVGLGLEGYLARNLKGFMEIKYQYVEDWQKIPIQLGVAYTF